MKSLTIGRKIALGFGALLLVTGLLGGLAIFNMWAARATARTLATEFVPEVDVCDDLAGDLSATQLAIRSYGYTADPAFLSEAHKQLAAVHADVEKAKKLAEEHPRLVKLREDLAVIAAELKNFETAVDATEARNTDITADRKKLDESAAGFIAALDRLIQSQKEKLQQEIKAGADAAALQERTTKLILAQEIRGLGNAARIAAFKAQALRNPSIFEDSLKNFEPMEAHFAELLAMLKTQTNIDELNETKRNAFIYRDVVRAVMEDSLALVEVGKRRVAAGTKLVDLADALSNLGAKRTVAAADASNEMLSSSSTKIVLGVVASLLIGFTIAFVIIRGTTKVLTMVANGLSEASFQVTAAAGQIAGSSQSLAEGASEQAASLEETSASLEEISSMTKRNEEGAQQAKELSRLTRSSADAGAGHMQEMRTAMDAIKMSSDDIAKIIKTIDEIAFQTNILALNAAVEAARAGEAGMGFAVVADEVRALAQRSAQSAKETAAKIEDAIRKSENGVTISAKVAEALTEIVDKARKVDALVAEIATASTEQTQGIVQVNTAVSQMDKVTQSNAGAAEESAAAAEELNAQAATMQESVAELRRMITDTVDTPSAPKAAAKSRSVPGSVAGSKPAPLNFEAPTARRQPKLNLSGVSTPGVNGHDDHFSS